MENDDLGEINIQNFQSIISNYETIVTDLTNQLDTFKVEQNNLKLRINDLLDENKELSYKLKEQENGNGDSNFQTNELGLVASLREQLDFVSKEKDSIMLSWQTSLDTIGHLENELKYYEGSLHGLVPKSELTKLKTIYENKIKSLEEEVEETKSKYESYLKIKSKEIEHKTEEIFKAVDTQCGTFEIIKNLEDEVSKLQQRLKDSQDFRTKLELELNACNEQIEAYKIENIDCRAKVSEAIQLVDVAIAEKDAALMREKAAKDEVEKLTQTLSEIIDEAGEKVKKEVELVKKEYNEKLKTLLVDLKAAQNDVKAKELEIEKYNTKFSELKKEIEKLKNVNIPTEESTTKFLSMQKTLETTVQQLIMSEKKNVQLASERENIKADMDQMASHYKRDIQAREVEKQTLQNKIRSLQSELDETHTKFVSMAQKMEILNNQIISTEKEFKEQISIKENMLRNSCKTVDKKNIELLSDVQKHVETQMKMNRKWKNETREIVDSLQFHVMTSKQEVAKLKKENKLLRQKLNEARCKLREYKTMLNMISIDIGKITDHVMDGIVLPKREAQRKLHSNM